MTGTCEDAQNPPFVVFSWAVSVMSMGEYVVFAWSERPPTCYSWPWASKAVVCTFSKDALPPGLVSL